jgi:hypothetical protein
MQEYEICHVVDYLCMFTKYCFKFEITQCFDGMKLRGSVCPIGLMYVK